MGGMLRSLAPPAILAAVTTMPIAQAGDIDALMKRVLDNRYTSWQKLGDFTLRHIVAVDIEAPLEIPYSRLRREYEWHVRNGVAVRSPVRFDGIDIGSGERRDAADDWRHGESLRRALGELQNLSPRFISDTFYGTEFPFEPGAYYYAGHGTVAGRDVVRIEYYPTGTGDPASNDRLAQGFNKTSVVTFWVDPQARQIARYTFENAGMDFLPLQWLARIGGFEVSAELMPVRVVWMPARTTLTVRVTTALGEFRGSITQEFFDYRVSETRAQVVGLAGPP